MKYRDLEAMHSVYVRIIQRIIIQRNTVDTTYEGVEYDVVFSGQGTEYTYPTSYLPHTPQACCLLSGKYVDNNSC